MRAPLRRGGEVAAVRRLGRTGALRRSLRRLLPDQRCPAHVSSYCRSLNALLLAHTRARERSSADVGKTRAAPNAPPGRLVRSSDRSRCNGRVIRRVAGPSRGGVSANGTEAGIASDTPTAVLLWIARRVSAARCGWRAALRSRERSGAIFSRVTRSAAGVFFCRRTPHQTAEERCSTSYKYLTAVGPRRRGFAAVLNDSEGETAPRSPPCAP